jgi:hypothetical protein
MKQKNIDKKILLGSILSVILIVMTTFNSVVGFHTTQSTPMIKSPLFTIRTQRAINTSNDQNVVSEYFGKTKTSAIPFPQQNTTLLQFQQAVDGISKMDDHTFYAFVDATMDTLQKTNTIDNDDISKIKELFQFVRENPEDAKKYPFDLRKHSYTIGCPPPTFDETPEWCFTLFVFVILLLITSPIWLPIYALYVFKENLFMNLSYRHLCFTIRPKCD